MQDSDSAYAVANIRCISMGADFTGCPSSAQQVTIADIGGIRFHLASYRRLLQRR